MNVHDTISPSLPEPLYVQLADLMRARIESGFWPAHHKLSAEPDLARQFGVSRGTLRNAIRVLMREDLISQVQGRGTFVLPQVNETKADSKSLASLLKAGGIHFETKMIERERIDHSDFLEGLIGTAPYLRMVRLRSVQEGPFTVMENVISLSVCGEIPEDTAFNDGFYAALEASLDIAVGEFDRSISAIPASEDIADRLQLKTGDPVLRIKQIGYLADGRPFEYASAVIRTDYHSLKMVV